MTERNFRTPWLFPTPDGPRRAPAPRMRPAPRPAGLAPPAPGAPADGRAPLRRTPPTTEPEPYRGRRGIAPWIFASGLAGSLVYVFGLAIAFSGNKEALGAIVTAPLLMLLGLWGARRVAAHDGNPDLVPLLMGALCLKLLGSLVRFWVAANVYGTGDFYDYDKWGRRIASGLRHGHLVDLPGKLAGTDFMRYLTGFIYFALPSRLLSGFLVYGFLSFVGLVLFWRAYRVAISTEHDITYLKWVVLMPSLVYWPSAIGKDAFMLLAAGMAAYGAACLLTDRVLVGGGAISLGVLGMVMVRPHFALAVCGGLALAILLRRNRAGFMRALVGIAFVVALGTLVTQSASSFFGISAFNHSSVEKALNDASNQSNQGGSSFSPVIVTSPVQFPLAAVTVFYRPLPFEAHSPQEFLTALEGVVLIGLTLRALRRSMHALRRSRDHPYLLYCLGALVAFVIAFSGFSNFGILARERSVIQPLFLVFLSLPVTLDPPEVLRRPRGYAVTTPERW